MDILTDIFGVDVEYESWNKQGALPMYIAGSYDFVIAILNGCRCIMLSPTEELVTIPALKKQIKRIQEIENLPVVIKLSGISLYKRKKMIASGIPFITGKQAFLPFMGTFLTQENEEVVEVNKLMFSAQQLALMYLYNNSKKLYVSDATKKLPFTAMTMSRAVKQLEATGLFYTTKDGVNKVIESDYNGMKLYEKIKEYMTSPVRKIGYLNKAELTADMVLAGDSVLAEATMLNPNRVMTYAIYTKSFVKQKLVNELIDPDEQVRVELWEYDPKQFSEDKMADRLSVALSFAGNEDERIEEAIEELLEGVWR